MTVDQIQYKHCSQYSVFRRSKRAGLSRGQTLSETDTAPVAVSCPQCKHVYMYEFHETTPILWTEPQGPGARKHPNIFFVPLVCDAEGCEDELVVIAAREANTPTESVLSEVPNWTLHDLHCPNGHPILVPRTLGPLPERD
jgi:hypothetical protein